MKVLGQVSKCHIRNCQGTFWLLGGWTFVDAEDVFFGKSGFPVGVHGLIWTGEKPINITLGDGAFSNCVFVNDSSTHLVGLIRLYGERGSFRASGGSVRRLLIEQDPAQLDYEGFVRMDGVDIRGMTYPDGVDRDTGGFKNISSVILRDCQMIPNNTVYSAGGFTQGMVHIEGCKRLLIDGISMVGLGDHPRLFGGTELIKIVDCFDVRVMHCSFLVDSQHSTGWSLVFVFVDNCEYVRFVGNVSNLPVIIGQPRFKIHDSTVVWVKDNALVSATTNLELSGNTIEHIEDNYPVDP